MAKKKPRQSDVRKTVPYAGLNARPLKGSFTINLQPSQEVNKSSNSPRKLPDPILEAVLLTNFLDAGDAFGCRRRALNFVVYSCLVSPDMSCVFVFFIFAVFSFMVCFTGASDGCVAWSPEQLRRPLVALSSALLKFVATMLLLHSPSTSLPILLISASDNFTAVTFSRRQGGTVTATTPNALLSCFLAHIFKLDSPSATPPQHPQHIATVIPLSHSLAGSPLGSNTVASEERYVSSPSSPGRTPQGSGELNPGPPKRFGPNTPTLHQRQVLIGDKLFRADLLSSPSTPRSCPLRFNLGREIEKGQFAPPLPCALIPTNRRNTPKSCARRLDRTETICLLPDVCSNILNQNECDDNMLRSVPVTTYWLRHGNVDVRGFDPIKPFSLSSNSIVLSVPVKAKLAFEIHLVSLRNFVEVRTDRANFNDKSSQIGLLLLGVAQSSRASHQKLLPSNSPTASFWCINVDFDYQLFLRTIALGIKVKLLHGVLHLAELDSPLIGFIFLCFVMLSTFVVPLSMALRSSTLVVNFHAL
ncbi:hypothetical protein DY000_02062748 [Brassica cretica]|uniref:Uncharacterized protein n=1 Tax=Brassica cretica TaxID=69181 RepID=A0ABQ7ASE6_BRACR|nr:hypothetical protein DY000_02062748 [Brassica cretica]